MGVLALAFGAGACGSAEENRTTWSATSSPKATLPVTGLSARPAADSPLTPGDERWARLVETLSAGESIPKEEPSPVYTERTYGDDDYDYQDEEEFALAIEGLRDPDPVERSDAVLDIDPDDRGLPYLLEVLSDDPDPEVRIAAVSQIGYAESPDAIAELVWALDDRDPDVVLEAIDALEFSADHTVIGSLEKLFQHPDPDVREAAEDAVDYLEE